MTTLRAGVQVSLGAHAYDIHIGNALLSAITRYVGAPGRALRVLTDEHVAALHLPALLSGLGISAEQVLVVKAGEPNKSWNSAEQVLDWMLSQKLSRDAVLLGLLTGPFADREHREEVIEAGEGMHEARCGSVDPVSGVGPGERRREGDTVIQVATTSYLNHVVANALVQWQFGH